MKSTILQTATTYIMPLLLLFSFFLLLRGHNEPGGGFTGGLVAATAYSLYAIAFGVDEARKLLRAEPIKLIALGLLIALLSGVWAMANGEIFMTGYWTKQEFPIIGKIGTPFIFDIGVYFVVLGIALKIIFTLSEEEAK
jgi:multicomponent Na+:H+ antiporter subunit B